jgi:hypothetical protein
LVKSERWGYRGGWSDRPRSTFGFSHASTVAGENDHLAIQNPGSQPANVTITYYGASSQTVKAVGVEGNSRVTVKLFDSANGVGPGQGETGIVLTSTPPT